MHEEIPMLDTYIPEKKTSDIAIVILPGGGYSDRAAHEGKGCAEFLNSHGITAFVCQYRVHPHKFPLPLLDARHAIRYVRQMKVSAEVHIYPYGGHGQGLAVGIPRSCNWPHELLEWLGV